MYSRISSDYWFNKTDYAPRSKSEAAEKLKRSCWHVYGEAEDADVSMVVYRESPSHRRDCWRSLKRSCWGADMKLKRCCWARRSSLNVKINSWGIYLSSHNSDTRRASGLRHVSLIDQLQAAVGRLRHHLGHVRLNASTFRHTARELGRGDELGRQTGCWWAFVDRRLGWRILT